MRSSIIVILTITILLTACQNSAPSSPSSTQPSTTPITTPTTTPTGAAMNVTSAQLAQHNTAGNCWVAYDGTVYDITSWLPVHPGGSWAIAPYCGTSDAFTNAFLRKHGTRNVGLLKQVGTNEGAYIA